jgi:hypothetical protein
MGGSFSEALALLAYRIRIEQICECRSQLMNGEVCYSHFICRVKSRYDSASRGEATLPLGVKRLARLTKAFGASRWT